MTVNIFFAIALNLLCYFIHSLHDTWPSTLSYRVEGEEFVAVFSLVTRR